MQGRLFEHEMPNGRSRDWAWKIIHPLSGDLVAAVNDGVNDWRSHMSEWGRSRLEPGDGAKCIQTLVWARAQERFVADDTIVPHRHVGMRMLIIQDAIAIRFKRLTEDLLVSPPQSDQAAAWYNNEPIAGFFNHLVRLNVGATMLGDEIGGIHLTWQSGLKQLGWAIPLGDDSGEMGDSNGTPVPFDPLGGGDLPMVPIRVPDKDEKSQEDVG